MRNPSITLIEPYVDPPSTFRAQKVEDTYSIATNNPLFNFSYQIGTKSTQIYELAVRNNTVSHNLSFDIIAPSFITFDTSLPFILEAGKIFKFRFFLDENDVRAKIFTRTLNYSEVLTISCKVLNVNGPVFIAKQLSSFSV